MRLRLSRDASRPLQDHLDELSTRGTAVLLVLSLAAVGWWLAIDGLLDLWLSGLSLGAAEGTVSIYDPHGWMTTRWSMIGLLALLTALPLAAQQLLTFADTGLLPSERGWLRAVTLLGVALGLGTILAWWLWAYPAAIGAAGVAGGIPGVAAQYDARLMFDVGIGVSWWLFLALLGSVSLSVARLFALVTTSPFDGLRVRVHGVVLFLWWLAAPDALQGVWTTGAVLLLLLPELVLLSMPRPLLSVPARAPTEVFDDEGGLRRRLFAMCACEDACPLYKRNDAPESLGWVEAEALCLDPDARDALLDAVVRHRVTDLAISGCDGTPLPFAFRRSVREAGCSLSGMGWLDDASSMRSDLSSFAGRIDE